MNMLAKAKQGLLNAFRTDPNINQVRSWAGPVSRRLPPATAEYLAEKLPIVQWLPHYDYRWLVQDAIAGITVGVMLIPQGLAYAKIAKIDIVNGLYSSFFPPALYFFLGTSKDLSVGPTSILGLLTAEVVQDLSREGYKPTEVAAAIAFIVGIMSLAIGLLKLGFLLDFVSAPVLTGWISAVALVIGLGQVGSLVGLETPSDTAGIVRAVLGHLGSIRPLTLCIGFTGIAMLVLVEQIGKRWGKKNRYVKFLATSRAVLVLVVFTLASYLANRGRDKNHLLWDVTRVEAHGVPAPKTHDSALLSKVVSRSVAPLVAMAVEHLGTGKAFAMRNGYAIDKSQELVYLGINNMVNSLFGALTTGAAMSRTAVNSDCGVHSPLSALFVSAFIILTLYELAPALYWIPKATLSAIIIMAVVHLIASPRQFYRFWKMSFVDFVASMLGFWVTLFTSTEIGLATAVGFSIVYTLLRLAFPRLVGLSHLDTESSSNTSCGVSDCRSSEASTAAALDVPPSAYLVQYTDDILFPNAERLKNAVLLSIKVHYEPPAVGSSSVGADDASSSSSSSSSSSRRRRRTWNPSSTRQIARIRKRNGIIALQGDETPLRRVVLDLTRVAFVDVTAVLSLVELKMELRRYVGRELEFRFVGMPDAVRQRFRRADWDFASPGQQRADDADVIYSSLELALFHDGTDDRDELAHEKTLDA